LGLAEVANLAVRINLEGNASRELTGLQKQVGGLSKGFGRAGKGIGQVGAGFARAGASIAVGLGALGVGAAKVAIDFEDAFAGIRKTVDETELKAAGLTFDDLEKSIRDMATTIPIAATELARIGETAGALGVGVKDIDEFVAVVAKLGVTTDLSSDQAAEALGKVGTILGLTGDEYETFADTLVHLGNVGASTESEIIEVTKRFAAMGKQAGLTNDEILALASAASSLGIEPEAAGSALSRIFSNMATEIANGTKKGKEFAKITGDSLDELRTKINQGDSLGILEDTLKGISGLSRTEAASVLKALGITNVRDRNAILLMAQNLGFVKDTLDESTKSVGALGKESQKKFATIASKLQLLKNNFIEAGITIGEGFLPALGRSAEKLSTFLKQPGNKGELKKIGEDIGEAIDGIEWDKVLDGAKSLVTVMKRALTFATKLFELFNALPTELKAAIVGGAAINKLSGGLVGQGLGNIAGGLAQGAASRLPGVGKLFAQPVFVTNFPPGFGKGGGGIGGGGKGGGVRGFIGGMGGILAAGVAAGLAVEAIALWDSTNQQSTEQAKTAHENVNAQLAGNRSTEELKTSLAAVETGINQIQANPLLTLVQGEALDHLRAMKSDLSKAIIARQAPANAEANQKSIEAREGSNGGKAPPKAPAAGSQAVTNAIKNASSISSRENSAQKTELGNVKNAVTAMSAQQRAQLVAQQAAIVAGNIAQATAAVGEALRDSAQTAELGLVKNSIATMDQGARANAVAAIAAQAAGNMLSVVQSASQAFRDGAQTTATTTAGTRAATASANAGTKTAGAVHTARSAIVSAIYAARPIINVTTVNRNTTTNNRYGPTGGSSNTSRVPGAG
jgi:TP901 family phage tail tape measure protein